MLLFTLEGFTPVAISCYGSSWNRTESIDAIAATGTTWDRLITPVTDPLAQLDRWLSNAQFPAGEMTVVTDDERLAELATSDAIGELILIAPRGETVAESIEDTTLGSLVAIAAEQLADNPHVWLHSRFLTRAWDAPRDLFPLEYFDEEDFGPLDPAESLEHEFNAVRERQSSVPPILMTLRPPLLELQPHDDPDLIMAWMRTYGCQIRLVDAMIGMLSPLAAESGHRAIAVAGTSGFSLGQNRWIGHQAGPLRSCHLHVPLLFSALNHSIPGGHVSGCGIRERLVRSADILPGVVAAMDDQAIASPISPAQWAACEQVTLENIGTEHSQLNSNNVLTEHQGANVAITTDDWFYVTAVSDEDESLPAASEIDDLGHLFLKPDDLCDINDVVRLKPVVASELRERMR
jgi:hypothetical protein